MPVSAYGWTYGGSPYVNNIQLALVNQLVGSYVPAAAGADMQLTINSNAACNFYTGTDRKPSATQYDLVTLILAAMHQRTQLAQSPFCRYVG